MSTRTIDPDVLKRSRLTERLGSKLQTTVQELPLAVVKSDDGRARAWRVTFSRVDRNDNAAPLVAGDPAGSQPQFLSQRFQYTAGFQTAPAVPPRRSNPVYGAAGGPPVWAQIVYGQSEGRPVRMLANWPMLGGSVVVYGSFVEVFGGLDGVSPVGRTEPQCPQLQAMITPFDGSYSEESNELSIQQEVLVEPAPPNGAVVYVPDFARRVKIACVAQANERVPATGEPLAQMVWYDDAGFVVDGALVGTVGSANLFSPVLWHAVPARATMMALYRTAGVDFFALFHWRIAP